VLSIQINHFIADRCAWIVAGMSASYLAWIVNDVVPQVMDNDRPDAAKAPS
jgi:hypothetical protein